MHQQIPKTSLTDLPRFNEYMIGVGGLCSVYDPPVSYWCSEHPSGGGAFAFRTPSGVIYKSPNGPYEHGNLAGKCWEIPSHVAYSKDDQRCWGFEISFYIYRDVNVGKWMNDFIDLTGMMSKGNDPQLT